MLNVTPTQVLSFPLQQCQQRSKEQSLPRLALCSWGAAGTTSFVSTDLTAFDCLFGPRAAQMDWTGLGQLGLWAICIFLHSEFRYRPMWPQKEFARKKKKWRHQGVYSFALEHRLWCQAMSWLSVSSEWRENEPSHEKHTNENKHMRPKELFSLRLLIGSRCASHRGSPGGRFDTASPFCTALWKLRLLPAAHGRAESGCEWPPSRRESQAGAEGGEKPAIRLRGAHVCLWCSAQPSPKHIHSHNTACCGSGYFSKDASRLYVF